MSRGPTEGSVQFSLKELVRLEEERIKEQQDDVARRAAAERETKERAERLAREAEEARARHAEENAQRKAQVDREEAARLEAIEQAALEHARWSAQMKAKSDEAERMRAHERDLERIRQSGAKGASIRGGLVGAAIAMTVTAAVAAIVYNASIAPQAAKREELLKAQVAERDGAVKTLGASVDDQKTRIDALSKQLSEAQDDNKRLVAELKRLKPAAAAPTNAGPSHGASSVQPQPPKQCPFGDKDPLCNTINGK